MSKELIDKVSFYSDNEIRGFFGEYRWLSNFHICDIWYDGLKYSSSEAAYQASKLPKDQRLEFTEMNPSQSMKEGRKRHLESDIEKWKDIRVFIMHEILFEKFRNKELRKMLLDTGNKYLCEDNWWKDQFWGYSEGIGENKLGLVLMSIRKHLMEIDKYK